MAFFTSVREKRLWALVVIVTVTIFSTLFIGRPLQNMLSDQNIQAIFFSLGLLLVGVTILSYGFQKSPVSAAEISIWIGLVAVYLMLFLRLGLPERSHLIEYSVLAIFLHLALVERQPESYKTWKTALLAFSITTGIGVLDEVIQIFLPHRVFDPNDIVFNSMAAVMAIGASLLLRLARTKVKQKRANK